MYDEIKLNAREVYDKKQMALAIKNSNYNGDISCSLLEEEILGDCSNCALNKICEGIDGVVRDLKDRTTKVVKTFEIS